MTNDQKGGSVHESHEGETKQTSIYPAKSCDVMNGGGNQRRRSDHESLWHDGKQRMSVSGGGEVTHDGVRGQPCDAREGSDQGHHEGEMR